MKNKTERIIKLNKALKFTAAVCLTLFFVFSVGSAIIGSASPFSQTTTAYAVENTTEFAGGDGSDVNPFLISSPAHLDNVRKYASNSIEIDNGNGGGEVDGDDDFDNEAEESDGGDSENDKPTKTKILPKETAAAKQTTCPAITLRLFAI